VRAFWLCLLVGCGARTSLVAGESANAGDASVAVDAAEAAVDASPIDTCACTAGSVETSPEGCATGSLKDRSCLGGCAWGPWSECSPRGWLPMAPAIEGRWRHDAVWTGSEMIVYGGQDAKTEAAAYSPKTNSWRTLPPSGLPFAGRGLVVWTGARLAIFSGTESAGRVAEYDPIADRWSTSPEAPISRRLLTRLSYLKGTNEVVVWGGADESGEHGDGAAYRLDTRTWRMMSTTPLSPRIQSSFLVTDDEVFIGYGGSASSDGLADGGIWNAKTNKWRYLGGSFARRLTQGVSDGSLHFLFGGVVVPTADPGLGMLFDFDAETFALLASAGSVMGPEAGSIESAVWAGGGRLWTFGGGFGIDGGFDRGGVYDPTSDTWKSLPPHALTERRSPSGVWIGDRSIVWGGCCDGTVPYADGMIFRP
jgi:hypothetical protein